VRLSRSRSSVQVIYEHPNCEECQVLTWLCDISPTSTDLDHRTFECPICLMTRSVTVKFK
jgi:hypothetical protein